MTEELRKPEVWEREFSVRIHDPDGWCGPNGKDWEEPISREEFRRRMMVSTIERLHPWEKIEPTAEGLARAIHGLMCMTTAKHHVPVIVRPWDELEEFERRFAIDTVQAAMDRGILAPGLSCSTILTNESFKEATISNWGSTRAYNLFMREFNGRVDELFNADLSTVIDVRNAGVKTWAVWATAFEQYDLRPNWVNELEHLRLYGYGDAFMEHCRRLKLLADAERS